MSDGYGFYTYGWDYGATTSGSSYNTTTTGTDIYVYSNNHYTTDTNVYYDEYNVYYDEYNVYSPTYTFNSPTYTIVNDRSKEKIEMSNRIKDFYNWLKEEQESLQEESGSDICGIIDRLEEDFPELSNLKKGQYLEITDDDLNFMEDEDLHIINERYLGNF